MFVWSFRMSKRELIIFSVGLVVFILVIALLLIVPSSSSESSLLLDSGYSLTADSAESRERFLSQFGWEIDADPVSVKEIIVPVKFDDTFRQYSELQAQQGFDMNSLAGKRVKLWSYRITNYPDVSGVVLANLMVMDGKVVGGDISSTAYDGFMHGFDPNAFAAQTAAAQLMNNDIDRTVPDSIPAQSDVPPEQDYDTSDTTA